MITGVFVCFIRALRCFQQSFCHIGTVSGCGRELNAHLIVLGFNDTSTLVGHFVSSPREREKRDRRDSRGDERDD